jgi:hypothetical protein
MGIGFVLAFEFDYWDLFGIWFLSFGIYSLSAP